MALNTVGQTIGQTMGMLAAAGALASIAAASPIILNFDELGLPHGTVITDQYASQGVYFSPHLGELQLRIATSPLFPAEPMGLAEIPYGNSIIIVTIADGALSAGAWIDFGSIGEGVRIEAFDGPNATGNMLATATTVTETYLGVEVAGIHSVRFRNVGGAGGTTYLIDNFTFVADSSPCYANCDASTNEPVLTVDDFTCFINEFASAQTLPHSQQVTHYANCDGSTTQPALTVDDFTCFINAFATGCE